MKYNFRTVTANTSATIDDHVIGVDTSTSGIGSNIRNVQLPTAASVRSGFLLVVKDIGGNVSTADHAIRINRGGTDTIDGNSSITINIPSGSISLFSNGVHTWHVY